MFIKKGAKMKNSQTFELYGSDIPGFNEMINAAKSIGNRSANKIANSYKGMKEKWINRLCKAIRESGIEPVGEVFLDITWIETNKRRDPDNIAAFIKFILDGLQKANIIENDGWGQIIGWENTFEIGPARGVKVRISNNAIK